MFEHFQFQRYFCTLLVVQIKPHIPPSSQSLTVTQHLCAGDSRRFYSHGLLKILKSLNPALWVSYVPKEMPPSPVITLC